MTIKSEGFLVGNTGIGNGNHLFLTSNEEALSFFRGKSLGTFDDYSVTRPDGQSMNAYQAGAIHVNMVYEDSIACDYIAFKNSQDTRWYFAMVMHREYVNERSTRLWFAIDWYATFCDKLKIGKCFIERTHVSDDNDKLYQLSEPIDAKRYMIFDAKNTKSAFGEMNDLHKDIQYNLLTTTDNKGTIANLKVNGDSGVPFIGTLTTGTLDNMLTEMKTLVSFSYLPVGIKNTMLQNVTALWVEPQGITDKEGIDWSIKFPENKWKHKKTLYYFHKFIINGYGGQSLPVEYSNSNKGTVTGRKYIISGPGGCSSISVNYGNWEGESSAGGRVEIITTPPWPQIPYSGAVRSHMLDVYGVNLDSVSKKLKGD